MSESIKLMSAQKVAEIFVKGVIDRKYEIFPGGSRFVWRVNRYFP